MDFIHSAFSITDTINVQKLAKFSVSVLSMDNTVPVDCPYQNTNITAGVASVPDTSPWMVTHPKHYLQQYGYLHELFQTHMGQFT